MIFGKKQNIFEVEAPNPDAEKRNLLKSLEEQRSAMYALHNNNDPLSTYDLALISRWDKAIATLRTELGEEPEQEEWEKEEAA
jgi:hypothetical protein